MRNRPGTKIIVPALVCLLSAMLAMAACNGGEDATTPADAVEWGYEGPGAPESWALLSEEYADCADGEQQSPVDIAGYVEGDAAPVSFSYGSDATAVRNDGKFVHVDYAPGSAFSLGQRSFELKSAHLHAPSEHLIDGASFAAELHLVPRGRRRPSGSCGPAVQAWRSQPDSASDSRCRPGLRLHRRRRQ